MCTNFLTKSKFLLSKKNSESPFIKIIIVIKNLSNFFSYSRQCSTLKQVHIGEKQFADFSISEKSQKRENVSRKWEERERKRETKSGREKFRSYILESCSLSLLFFSLFRRGDHFSSWFFSLFFVDSPSPSPILLGIIMSNRFRWDFNEGEKIWKVCRGIFTRRIIFILKMNSSILNHRLTWQPFR